MGQKVIKNSLPHKGSTAVQNPNQIVDELIEIGRFSKILEKEWKSNIGFVGAYLGNSGSSQILVFLLSA